MKNYGRLNTTYNNAGLHTPQIPAAEMSYQDYNKTMAVNLRDIFTCMKYQIPALLQSGGGAIVNCSSRRGVTGFPVRRHTSPPSTALSVSPGRRRSIRHKKVYASMLCVPASSCFAGYAGL
ncbi:SDR family NAD(P)-dependent oxidoreductase [uncultured Bilophila sp.]|uniref:SDR family NAD(P)-dependent oxidoreductase n=1 Tax=uncultured Bilophila sp. TaxID=529385 RepID=UPI0025D4E2BC|nr:SDR family NAD(P)-dependent oxidoreductase [uncultured Bilophila sp.]